MRIRDIRRPPNVTLPLNRDTSVASTLGPFPGKTDPFSQSMAPTGGCLVDGYVAIAPLCGSALHIFMLHFCNLSLAHSGYCFIVCNSPLLIGI